MNDVTVFPESRALHGESRGGPSAGLEEDGIDKVERKDLIKFSYLLEGLVVLLIIRHFGEE